MRSRQSGQWIDKPGRLSASLAGGEFIAQRPQRIQRYGRQAGEGLRDLWALGKPGLALAHCAAGARWVLVNESSERMIHEQLPAVITKIARMLAVKPEYCVTHPSELKVVQALSDSELRDLAYDRGWRFVRRVGGRSIEFHNDAGLVYRPL